MKPEKKSLREHWRKVVKKYEKLRLERPLKRVEQDQLYLAQYELEKTYQK